MSALAEISNSIARYAAKHSGQCPRYIEISDDEWRTICQEQFGGPWLGGLAIRCVTVYRYAEVESANLLRRSVAGLITKTLWV